MKKMMHTATHKNTLEAGTETVEVDKVQENSGDLFENSKVMRTVTHES